VTKKKQTARSAAGYGGQIVRKSTSTWGGLELEEERDEWNLSVPMVRGRKNIPC